MSLSEMQMSTKGLERAVRGMIAVACLVSGISGVQRQAKVREALYLQCRSNDLIRIDNAMLVSGLMGPAADASLDASPLSVERCHRVYQETDDDFRILMQRCSGRGSCGGIVSASNLTLTPCGARFGENSEDFLEVSYTCIEQALIADICSSSSKELFTGFIQSPSYPSSAVGIEDGTSRRVRCSCLLASQNFASIELLLLDVGIDNTNAKLEMVPAVGRPLTRLCAGSGGNATGFRGGSSSTGCVNRRYQTSYSRLNVTFTVNQQPAGLASLNSAGSNRFFLQYSGSHGVTRVQSVCQLLEGGTLGTPAQPQDDEGAASTTSILDAPTIHVAAPSVEEASQGAVILVSAVVPVLLLLAVGTAIAVRAVWVYHRQKKWLVHRRKAIPCCCCFSRTARLSFAPFVGRLFSSEAYCNSSASKCGTMHTYDEAAIASCHAECEEDHYDSIPAHHHYQEVEFGGHYETVAENCKPVAGRVVRDSGESEESTTCRETAMPRVGPSSDNRASRPTAGLSQSTVYEDLADGTSPLRGHSYSSVQSLGIDFSDIVAESLKRMSTPKLLRSLSTDDCPQGRSGCHSPGAPTLQSEDYLSPSCVHAANGACCSRHTAARKVDAAEL